MGRSFRRLLILAWVLQVVYPNSVALAYPTPVDFDGTLSRWDIKLGAEPITVAVVGDNEEDVAVYTAAVEDATKLWSDVSTSYFKYQMVDASASPQVTIHLQSSISGPTESAGYAIFDKYSGKYPSHCSIFVQMSDYIAYYDMSKTILHEFGHCLGLGHSLVPEAIMSYYLTKNGFYLSLDDEAAVARLYPIDGSTPRLPPGCAVRSGTGRQSRSGWLIALMFAPLLIAAPTALRRTLSGQ